jgi:hypothetical protein
MGKYSSNNFREFLINEKTIPLKNIRFYQVWVDTFLSYYQKNLKAVKYDGLVKSRHSGENRSPDDLQLFEKTGFRLSPE